MSLVYNSNKFQYAVSQSLPFGEVRRGFLFNAFNCMKAYSYSGERYGYYGYDASGERTYKIELDKVTVTTNEGEGAQAVSTCWEVDQMMLYPNGYMNMDQTGAYTKHYYADALRIASKIGSGFEESLCDVVSIINDDYPGYLDNRITIQYDEMKEELTELVVDGEEISDITPLEYPNLCDVTGGGNESELFFYHADHLGSTGMVTDINSQVTQGLLYAPFGEIITDYQPQFHSTPMPNYAFNAKELDEENGMYYYSARYYAPPTFISRDPMFEKYPSISPYAYCRNNPLKFVDPTGEDWDPVIDEKKGTITIKAIYYTAKGNKDELQKSLDVWNNESGKYTYTVGEGNDKKVYTINFDLQVAEGDYADDEAAADAYMKDKSGYANYFQEGDPVDKNNNPARGSCENGKIITVRNSNNTRTNKHEIGHTLGLGDWNAGLMLSGGDGNYIFTKYVKKIMNSSGFGEVSNDGFLYQTDEAAAKPAHNYSNTKYSKGKIRTVLY